MFKGEKNSDSQLEQKYQARPGRVLRCAKQKNQDSETAKLRGPTEIRIKKRGRLNRVKKDQTIGKGETILFCNEDCTLGHHQKQEKKTQGGKERGSRSGDEPRL